MRRWCFLPLAAALSACVIAPIRPVGFTQPIDLAGCYLWPHQPGANDHNVDYFILSDGSPSFKAIKWAPDLGAATGCDFAFTIGVAGGLSPVWQSSVYSVPSRRQVAQVSAQGLNFSYLAQALYRELCPGTAAYQAIKADAGSPVAGGPAPASAVAEPIPAEPSAGAAPAPEPEIHAPRPQPVTLAEAELELLP